MLGARRWCKLGVGAVAVSSLKLLEFKIDKPVRAHCNVCLAASHALVLLRFARERVLDALDLVASLRRVGCAALSHAAVARQAQWTSLASFTLVPPQLTGIGTVEPLLRREDGRTQVDHGGHADILDIPRLFG
jgi:hypothetical protein